MAKIKTVNLNANGVLDNLKSTVNSNIKEENSKQVKSDSSNEKENSNNNVKSDSSKSTNTGISKQVITESSNKEKEYSDKPVISEKKKKNKCNYMLTDDTLTQLLELQLYTVKAGKKKDFSALVTESINDLYKKYLGEK